MALGAAACRRGCAAGCRGVLLPLRLISDVARQCRPKLPATPFFPLLPSISGFDELASALAHTNHITTLNTLASSVQGACWGSVLHLPCLLSKRQFALTPAALAASPSPPAGITLLLMVVRLMWSLTAQRRLSVITRTVVQSASALAHLLLLAATGLALLVVAGVLVLGDLTQALGDLPSALRSELGLRAGSRPPCMPCLLVSPAAGRSQAAPQAGILPQTIRLTLPHCHCCSCPGGIPRRGPAGRAASGTRREHGRCAQQRAGRHGGRVAGAAARPLPLHPPTVCAGGDARGTPGGGEVA